MVAFRISREEEETLEGVEDVEGSFIRRIEPGPTYKDSFDTFETSFDPVGFPERVDAIESGATSTL